MLEYIDNRLKEDEFYEYPDMEGNQELVVTVQDARNIAREVHYAYEELAKVARHAATCLKFMSDDFAIGCVPDAATATGQLSQQLKDALVKVGVKL